MTSCHSGLEIGERSDEIEIHALVDHAEEAEARPRNRRLIRRLDHRQAGLGKCDASMLLAKR